MISGYFFYSPDRQKAVSRCKRALRKIILIFLAANLFYMLFLIALRVAAGQIIHLHLDIKSILSFLLIGDNINPHLWYLTAYIQVLLVVFAALRLKKENLVWIIIPVGLLLSLISGTYSFLLPEYPFYSLIRRCFFTIGIPFFGIGYLIRKYEPLILQGRLRTLGHPAVCLLFLIFSTVEARALLLLSDRLTGDIIFFTIPLSISLFIFCLRQPNLGSGSFTETIGQKYATEIYIFQMFTGILFTIISHRLSTFLQLPEILSPVFIFMFALLFSILLRQFLSYLRLSLSPSK